MSLSKDLYELIEKVTDELLSIDKNLLDLNPPNQYISLLFQYPSFHYHNYVSNDIKALADNIKKKYGEYCLEKYHQLVLLNLIEKKAYLNGPLSPTERIKENTQSKLKCIIADIRQPILKIGKFGYAHERFTYSLGICKGSTYPFGPFRMNQFKSSYLGLAKHIFQLYNIRNLVTQGIRYYFKRVINSPHIEVHLDIFDKETITYFNKNGWKELFIELDRFLTLNPHICSIVGNSWFFDDKLDMVSPELLYIREICEKLNGKFYNIGPTASGISNAIRFSHKRSSMFSKGLYYPTNHVLILSKSDLKKNLKFI